MFQDVKTVFSTSTPSIKLRPYQQTAIDRIQAIYEANPDDERGFLILPTGSGKTFTGLCLTIKALKGAKPKTCIWVAHQTALVSQSASSFEKNFIQLGGSLSSDGKTGQIGNIRFVFMTWQSLRNQVATVKADMLVVDEVHYGSSLNGTSKGVHKSFKKILKRGLIKTHLYITATPQSLNPDVFPGLIDKAGNVVTSRKSELTIFEAHKIQLEGYSFAGIIADIEFKVFHSADTVKIKQIEGDLEETIEADSSEELAKEFKTKKVGYNNPESLRKIKASLRNTLLSSYLDLECTATKIPPTIIFCGSVNDDMNPLSLANVAKSLKAAFRKRFGNKVDISNQIRMIHSDVEDSQNIIESFQRDEFKILLVVRMAREGFDHQLLEVAIDLCPSANIKSTTQKVGRLFRLYPDKTKKKVGRYYYADTFQNYIVDKNGNKLKIRKEIVEQIKEELRPQVEEEFKSLDAPQAEFEAYLEDATQSYISGTEMLTNTSGADESGVGIKEISTKTEFPNLQGMEKRARAVITTIKYVLVDADNIHKNHSTEKLFSLLEQISNQQQTDWDSLSNFELFNIIKGA